jgi:hypothetical protein
MEARHTFIAWINAKQAERKRGKEQSEELERLQAKCIDGMFA